MTLPPIGNMFQVQSVISIKNRGVPRELVAASTPVPSLDAAEQNPVFGPQSNQRIPPSSVQSTLSLYVSSDATYDATETSDTNRSNSQADDDLSPEEHLELDKIRQRDAEVRNHETAHLSAAGPFAQSGASFDFKTGPDGRRYAVGGDVSISVSEEQTPEATIAKMQTVRRAALAPASPSAQDRRVAADAAQKEAQAQKELSSESPKEGWGANNNTLSRSGGLDEIQWNADTKAAARSYGRAALIHGLTNRGNRTMNAIA